MPCPPRPPSLALLPPPRLLPLLPQGLLAVLVALTMICLLGTLLAWLGQRDMWRAGKGSKPGVDPDMLVRMSVCACESARHAWRVGQPANGDGSPRCLSSFQLQKGGPAPLDRGCSSLAGQAGGESFSLGRPEFMAEARLVCASPPTSSARHHHRPVSQILATLACCALLLVSAAFRTATLYHHALPDNDSVLYPVQVSMAPTLTHSRVGSHPAATASAQAPAGRSLELAALRRAAPLIDCGAAAGLWEAAYLAYLD